MGSQPTSDLFSPLKVGHTSLAHRVVMAPMTRRRATDDHVPTPLMVSYYSQRASVPGTLLISESTAVSPRSASLPNTPGIWTKEQIEAWKPITAAVHERGCFLFMQMWMCGRAARAGAVKRGAEVISASDVPISSESPVPRPLIESEIATCVQEFRQAAVNAIEAGFDGVELHGANGYLLDQFTQDVSNKRVDEWGGSIEKRSRFPVAVARAVAEAIGPKRVGYRISPWSRHHGMRMENPKPQFVDLVGRLKELGLAYLHVIESRVQGPLDVPVGEGEDLDWVAEIWGNTSPIIFAGGYNADTARRRVDSEWAQGRSALVAFGRTFVSNPDLPLRVEGLLPINGYIRDLFYEVGVEAGYLDYPSWREQEKSPSAPKDHVWPTGLPSAILK